MSRTGQSVLVHEVRCQVIEWVDDWQPGWVRAQLVDANGHAWTFVEKTTQFDIEPLITRRSPLPIETTMRCQVIERRADEHGRLIVTVNTDDPDGVASEEGQTMFDVDPTLLIDAQGR